MGQDGLQVDQHVGVDDALAHQLQQIRAATGYRRSLALPCRIGEGRKRVLHRSRVHVGEALHAAHLHECFPGDRQVSMRRPVALKTALAIAATEGMMPDSPRHLDPNGTVSVVCLDEYDVHLRCIEVGQHARAVIAGIQRDAAATVVEQPLVQRHADVPSRPRLSPGWRR